MTKRVVVTRAQQSAAQAMVKRSALTGRPVSESVHKIANATVVYVKGTEATNGSK